MKAPRWSWEWRQFFLHDLHPKCNTPCSDVQQCHACAITKTIGWIKVAEQHKRAARLESKTNGSPEALREFRNSVGYTWEVSLLTLSMPMRMVTYPGNLSRIMWLSWSTASFFGERMVCSKKNWSDILPWSIPGYMVSIKVWASLWGMHVGRQLDGFVRSEVRSSTNFWEPLSELITLWGAIQTHVLDEMQDLDMPPQPWFS